MMNPDEKKQKKTTTNKSRKNSFGRFRENSEARKATGVCPKNQSEKNLKKERACVLFFSTEIHARVDIRIHI